jgi:predicted AlkP superfamily pyrophosphatase or phosphodiesterase
MRGDHQGFDAITVPFQGIPMRLSLALFAATLALAVPAAAKQAAPPPPPPAAPPLPAPKLVVAVSIDQFSADLFAEYRQHFTGGFARLLSGAVFPSGFQSHAATETCPGHSTILTGARPARTGIIANNWFDQSLGRAEKRVYCSEDVTDPASSPKDPVVTPNFLKVPTLGDRLKAVNKASRNVAVSAKDRAVMMMGGHTTDAAFWWKKDAFVTLKGAKVDKAVAADVAEASQAAARTIADGAPEVAVPQWCAVKDRAIPLANGAVGTGHFAVRPGKEADFRASPRMDSATGALALKIANDLKLGRGKATDVLSVSLSATDYVGHGNGTEGVEMCIQLMALDQTLGALFDGLDAQGIDYVAVLTADHGGYDVPERLDRQAYPQARRIDDSLSNAALTQAVIARSGVAAPASGPLLYSDGPFGDFYVSRALSPDDRARAIAGLVEVAKANPQVQEAFTAQELAATPSPTGSPQDFTLIQRARASFDPQRSGDVVILLKRGMMPIAAGGPGYAATHGSPWDYDRRVPILFWRKGYAGFEQPHPVETVDIAPSLAAVVGLKVPAGKFDGRCLDLDGGERDTCATR